MMSGKLITLGIALVVTLCAPFLLRPKASVTAKNADATLSVITPHNETIRQEFSRAFTKHMKRTRNQTVHIDWRTPGSGTADLERYLQSEYRANFENYWRNTLHREWNNSEIATNFDNRRLVLPENEEDDKQKHSAIFL